MEFLGLFGEVGGELVELLLEVDDFLHGFGELPLGGVVCVFGDRLVLVLLVLLLVLFLLLDEVGMC